MFSVGVGIEAIPTVVYVDGTFAVWHNKRFEHLFVDSNRIEPVKSLGDLM